MSTTLDIRSESIEVLTAVASERREFVKATGVNLAALGALSVTGTSAFAAQAQQTPDAPEGADNFYKSDKVSLQKVNFKNQYGMQVAGNLFVPKARTDARLPALVVGHPMGAVK